MNFYHPNRREIRIFRRSIRSKGSNSKAIINNIIPTGDDLLPGNGESLRFISRSQWLAQPAEADLFDLDLPSNRLIIAHTATENCSNQVNIKITACCLYNSISTRFMVFLKKLTQNVIQ